MQGWYRGLSWHWVLGFWTFASESERERVSNIIANTRNIDYANINVVLYSAKMLQTHQSHYKSSMSGVSLPDVHNSLVIAMEENLATWPEGSLGMYCKHNGKQFLPGYVHLPLGEWPVRLQPPAFPVCSPSKQPRSIHIEVQSWWWCPSAFQYETPSWQFGQKI